MLNLRSIRPEDNAAVARVVRTVMPEFGCVGEGFSITDPELEDMFSAYSGARAGFFVLEDPHGGEVVGVAGYDQLTAGPEDMCELRKMYILPGSRGRGGGKQLIRACLHGARLDGYRRMYLETVNSMTQAAGLYAANGFSYLEGPLGGTGHTGCDRFMVRDL